MAQPSLPLLVKQYSAGAWTRYKKAPLIGKAFVWFLILFHTALFSTIFIVGPAKIAQFLYDLSQDLRKLRFGWLLLASFIAITSFPPLVGWSTSISVCGFAYGLKGWFVAAGGAMVGAAMTFVILRLFFGPRIRSWTKTNQKWQALEAVIVSLTAITAASPRTPLNYIDTPLSTSPMHLHRVYANMLFASIETVSFFQFMVATLCYTPKLMFAVWVGSRIAMLSDGQQRGEMDTAAKIVNTLSIVLGVAIGVGTGWLIYRLTEEQIRKAPGNSPEVDELAAEALEDAANQLEEPLLRSFSHESYPNDQSPLLGNQASALELENGFASPKSGRP